MMDNQTLQQPLKVGEQLTNYKIEKVLGSGGFGIAYLATDVNLERKVVIKEFFPINQVMRSGGSEVQLLSSGNNNSLYHNSLKKFLAEGRTLAKFKHDNIALVLSAFPENNTAYLVMEYNKGETLADFIKKHNKPLDFTQIKKLFLPICKGLQALHKQDLLHLDVKPDNIYLPDRGEPYLIDFGGVRQFIASKDVSVSFMVLMPGYAPVEQHSNTSKLGFYSDVYALGMTIYYALTLCEKLPESINRQQSLFEGDDDPLPLLTDSVITKNYPKDFIAIIEQAIQPSRKNRLQSIDDLISVLSGKKVKSAQPNNHQPNKQSSPLPLKKIIITMIVLTMLGLGVWQINLYQQQQEKTRQADKTLYQNAKTTLTISSFESYLDHCQLCEDKTQAKTEIILIKQQQKEAKIAAENKQARITAENKARLKQARITAENKARLERQARLQAERQAKIATENKTRLEAERQTDHQHYLSARKIGTVQSFQGYIDQCQLCENKTQARAAIILIKQQQKEAKIAAEREQVRLVENQARLEAERQARIAAENKARLEAEKQARIVAENKARLEAERQTDRQHYLSAKNIGTVQSFQSYIDLCQLCIHKDLAHKNIQGINEIREKLLREWEEMGEEEWRDLSLDKLNSFIQAGASVNAKDKYGGTPLHYAAWSNQNPAIIKALIQAGASVNVKDKYGRTPLHRAAWYNQNPAIIKALIQAGASVNVKDENGGTPLHLAAWSNQNPAIIKALIQAGASVNVKDKYGGTPLHLAALSNQNPAIIKALIQAGASVNVKDKYGETPLHGAAELNQNPAIIKALIQAGASVNVKDLDGHTPLHHAAGFNQNPASIKALIQAGASVNARDVKGNTAFDMLENNDKLTNDNKKQVRRWLKNPSLLR